MAGASSIEAAMQASRNAAARSLEARYRVADTISEEILARPDAAEVADEVLEFLSGPWAQVVAQARISNRRGASDADGFAALIPVLIWSVQPKLTRRNQPMLVRQVPKLVAKLREGLASIQFPGDDSLAFFKALMRLHERGLRSDGSSSATFAAMLEVDTEPAQFHPDAFQPDAHFPDSVQPDSVLANAVFPDPVRPDALPSQFPPPDSVQPESIQPNPAGLADTVELSVGAERSESAEPVEPVAERPLALGAWFELRADSDWKPTQLTWANPGGTLFLFTSPSGATHSMTRRSLNKLLATGKIRAAPADVP